MLEQPVLYNVSDKIACRKDKSLRSATLHIPAQLILWCNYTIGSLMLPHFSNQLLRTSVIHNRFQNRTEFNQ